MRLLYFTLEGFDTPNPNNHLAETTLDYILDHNVSVDLIQSSRTHLNEEVPNRLKEYSNLHTYSFDRDIIKKDNFIKRYIEEAFFVMKSVKIWFKNRKEYDVLYVQSNATIVWTLLLFRILIRKPIVYVIYDIFPGQSMSLGIVKYKLLYKTFEILQKMAYKCSTKIIVLSDDMKNTLINLKVATSKIEVVYPWYDDKIFTPLTKIENKFYKEWKLDNNMFYLQYAGSLGQNFDEDFVFQIAKKLMLMDDIAILLIGDGIKKESIKLYIEENKIENIKMIERQDLENINYVYNTCDLGIVPLKNNVIKYGFPSKVCQLMACGKPIVTYTNQSLYAKLINKGFGYAGHDDIDRFIQNIMLLKNDRQLYEKTSLKCIEFAKLNYTASANCEKLLSILGGVCNAKK